MHAVSAEEQFCGEIFFFFVVLQHPSVLWKKVAGGLMR